MSNKILNKTIEEWIQGYPVIEDLINLKEVFWVNPKYENFNEAISKINIGEKHIKEAEDRLKRFAPLIRKHFSETEDLQGIIESPIEEIPLMKKELEKIYDTEIFRDKGRLITFKFLDKHLREKSC